MSSSATLPAAGLVNNQLSGRLHLEILNGSLKPGEHIIEGKRAAKFDVAQASISEDINILAQAGFVTKAPGRRVRVIHLSESDGVHIYQVRRVIEGLATRLAAQSRQDLTAFQLTMDSMRESARARDRERLIDCDLFYHLALCEFSRNPYLIDHGRRILVPLFAFVRMHVSASGQSKALQRQHATIGKSGKRMPGELNGKVIVLTGGAGIGRECATAYVREGAVVAVLDRDGEKAAQTAAELGPDCMAVQADVGEGPAVDAGAELRMLSCRHFTTRNRKSLNSRIIFIGDSARLAKSRTSIRLLKG